MDTVPEELERHIISYLNRAALKTYSFVSKGRRALVLSYYNDVAKQARRLLALEQNYSTRKIIDRLFHLNADHMIRLDTIWVTTTVTTNTWHSPTHSIISTGATERWLPYRINDASIIERLSSGHIIHGWMSNTQILYRVDVSKASKTLSVSAISDDSQYADFKCHYMPHAADIPKHTKIKRYYVDTAHHLQWLVIPAKGKQWALALYDCNNWRDTSPVRTLYVVRFGNKTFLYYKTNSSENDHLIDMETGNAYSGPREARRMVWIAYNFYVSTTTAMTKAVQSTNTSDRHQIQEGA